MLKIRFEAELPKQASLLRWTTLREHVSQADGQLLHWMYRLWVSLLVTENSYSSRF